MADRNQGPAKAIRKKCMECRSRSPKAVKLCSDEECPLHPYRFGKNPYRTHTMSPERKAAAVEVLRKAAAEKKNK